MKVQFDWQSGDEHGRWETIATVERCTSRKIPPQVWGIAAIVLVISVTGGYVGLSHRYAAVLREITLQIQSVIDLEARALARGDLDLFIAQQDRTAPGWLEWQTARAHKVCSQGRCAPGDLSVQVQSVEMRGDTAWVDVVSGQDPVRQAWFYRRTDRGWVHTATRGEFWRDPVRLRYGNVVVRCDERDLPHVMPLVALVSHALEDVCTILDFPPARALEMRFTAETSTIQSPRLSGSSLVLPSPWLSGIPLDGTWNEDDLDTLRYWVAFAGAAQSTRLASTPYRSALQKAFATQYVAVIRPAKTVPGFYLDARR